ncbi:MAG: XrtA-associated ATPase [Gammaproteobacteria bacterium]|jgi:general secretion pathway protein A
MYESYYKLNSRPFQLSPDPRFFYGSTNHKRALSYLRYGLSQGEGFIVVTGEIGTGKTMLVKMLIEDLAQENVIVGQLVTTQLQEDDTLRMVAASFGLPYDGLDKAAILNNLESFMMSRTREGKRLLLLVDEAQNLPQRSLEELRLLSNFQLGKKVLLQSFLLGQPEFRNTLQAKGLEQLRQRVKAAYHLTPLNAEQTRNYIEYRLHAAGWRNNPKFSDAAFAAIYKCTDGVPRRINTFCDRLLLFGMLDEIHEFDAEEIRIVMQELLSELPANNSTTITYERRIRDRRKPTGGPGNDNRTAKPPHLSKSSPKQATAIPLDARVEALENRLMQLERAILTWINSSTPKS